MSCGNSNGYAGLIATWCVKSTGFYDVQKPTHYLARPQTTTKQGALQDNKQMVVHKHNEHKRNVLACFHDNLQSSSV